MSDARGQMYLKAHLAGGQKLHALGHLEAVAYQVRHGQVVVVGALICGHTTHFYKPRMRGQMCTRREMGANKEKSVMESCPQHLPECPRCSGTPCLRLWSRQLFPCRCPAGQSYPRPGRPRSRPPPPTSGCPPASSVDQVKTQISTEDK